jgi:dihydrolipoamide dehydrogenase
MAGTNAFDLVVIGSGPGGYVGAIRAAQLGMKVGLIEKAQHLGGTCLNWGCIPTKALLESAKTYDKLKHLEELGFNAGNPTYDWVRIMARKEGIVDSQRKGLRFLMKKNKIEVFEGHGRLAGPGKVSVTGADGKATTVETKKVLLATGSRVRQLPFAKSNGKTILSSDDVLSITDVPKTMAVIGGGVVGIEFASLFGRFGTQVTVIEVASQILPSEDEEAVGELMKNLKKQNITFEIGTKVTAITDNGGKSASVTLEGGKPKEFERVLISIGREPVTNDIGLELTGVKTDRGFVIVDSHYKTNVEWVYAIGDIIPTPALAHTASAEAIHAVEAIAGKNPNVINYQANPNAIYCYPEIASIGMTEQTIKQKKIEYKSGKFPFAPMAKAKIENATEGFIKILFEPKYREILGVHIVGAKATELIAEFALGKVLETTVDEIGQTIHPHPTISETVMEAAHAALGHAIHM